jgi:hypothetical protein
MTTKQNRTHQLPTSKQYKQFWHNTNQQHIGFIQHTWILQAKQMETHWHHITFKASWSLIPKEPTAISVEDNT